MEAGNGKTPRVVMETTLTFYRSIILNWLCDDNDDDDSGYEADDDNDDDDNGYEADDDNDDDINLFKSRLKTHLFTTAFCQ